MQILKWDFLKITSKQLNFRISIFVLLCYDVHKCLRFKASSFKKKSSIFNFFYFAMLRFFFSTRELHWEF